MLRPSNELKSPLSIAPRSRSFSSICCCDASMRIMRPSSPMSILRILSFVSAPLSWAGGSMTSAGAATALSRPLLGGACAVLELSFGLITCTKLCSVVKGILLLRFSLPINCLSFVSFHTNQSVGCSATPWLTRQKGHTVSSAATRPFLAHVQIFLQQFILLH